MRSERISPPPPRRPLRTALAGLLTPRGNAIFRIGLVWKYSASRGLKRPERTISTRVMRFPSSERKSRKFDGLVARPPIIRPSVSNYTPAFREARCGKNLPSLVLRLFAVTDVREVASAVEKNVEHRARFAVARFVEISFFLSLCLFNNSTRFPALPAVDART